MVDGLEKRLAEAVTDEEAKAVLLAAAREAWPDDEGHNARYVMRSRALAILNGPSAGWIGVGVLMMPKGHAWWDVGRIQADDSPMKGFSDGSTHRACIALSWGDERGRRGYAMRPDCALVLAALKQITAAKLLQIAGPTA